jgi:hypothetical protein
MMVQVKFVQKFAPYQAGEVAGFSEDRAAKLVSSGIAEYLDKPVRKFEVPNKMVSAPEVSKDAQPEAAKKGHPKKQD